MNQKMYLIQNLIRLRKPFFLGWIGLKRGAESSLKRILEGIMVRLEFANEFFSDSLSLIAQMANRFDILRNQGWFDLFRPTNLSIRNDPKEGFNIRKNREQINKLSRKSIGWLSVEIVGVVIHTRAGLGIDLLYQPGRKRKEKKIHTISQ